MTGFQLKSRVTAGELSAQQALDWLRREDPSVNTTPKENRTVRWLIARGAFYRTTHDVVTLVNEDMLAHLRTLERRAS